MGFLDRFKVVPDIVNIYIEKKREIPKHLYIKLKKRKICKKCKLHVNHVGTLQIHHIKPVSKGGKSIEQNLMAVCEKCHEELHTWMKRNEHKRGKKE